MTEEFTGLPLYIVFKHVWTESDTGGKEYKFENVFTSLSEARIYCDKHVRPMSIYGDMVVDSLIFDQNAKQTGELYWEPKYGSWINKGAFKSVKPRDILRILNRERTINVE